LFVKICGVTNLEDALHAVRCGADAIGLNFYSRSPRYVDAERAASIVAGLPDHISTIGVFVNATRKEIRRVIESAKLSAVQLHGNEGPDDLVDYDVSAIKVFRVGNDFDAEVMRNYIVHAFLLDAKREGTFGGSGTTFDWNIAVRAKEYGRIILSGGLTPENVEVAVRFVQPYGVDVCSGVESKPGIKDPEKVREFIVRAKSVPLAYSTDFEEE
jgi:phosphoribosylanthranilate isomerase